MTSQNRRNRSRSRRGLLVQAQTTRGGKVEGPLGGKQPRRVLIAVAALMVAVGAYFGYRHYAEAPAESNSQVETPVVILTERESHESMVATLVLANSGGN